MKNWTLLVFAAGVLSGMVYLTYLAKHPNHAYAEEERIGIHLADGEGFLSPFMEGAQAPPTSWCPPVYPAIVSVVYRGLGVRTAGAIVALLGFNLLCRAAAGVAVFWLGRKLFGKCAGLLAAGLLLVNPIVWQAAGLPWDNTLALAMFLWLLVAAICDPCGAGIVRPAALGIGLGLLTLTNAAYVLAIPVVIVVAAKGRRSGVGIASAALIITLLPWTLRNEHQFHRLFFIRGNLYTELWLGNQPISTGWMTGINLQSHPSEDPANRQLIVSLGETGYSDVCRRRFWADYNASPRKFWERCGNRLAYLFLGEPKRPLAWFHMTVAVLGLAGAWMAWRTRHRCRGLLGAGFLAVVPYLPTQVHDRYVTPWRAVLSLLAAYLLCEVSRRQVGRRIVAFQKEAPPAGRMQSQ